MGILKDKMADWGGRKYTLAAATLLINSGLVIGAYIPPTVYATVVLGTVGAYIAGNVIQKKTTEGG
jgi:hypothetical protein